MFKDSLNFEFYQIETEMSDAISFIVKHGENACFFHTPWRSGLTENEVSDQFHSIDFQIRIQEMHREKLLYGYDQQAEAKKELERISC